MTQDKLSIGYILKKWVILLGIAILVLFSFSNVLAQESSPSGTPPQPERPFIDDNKDGIDDFEQKTGDYADPEIRAKIYRVEFPISDLGDCSSYYECRSYCEDPVNGEACINYGKARGFYKDDPVILEKDKILGEARRRLGCDSYESCLNFCEIPANYDKCHSFAKSQGIVGGVVDDPAREEVIAKAKEVLGCDSANSCQAFCLQQDNINKCKSFAEEVGLRGGEHKVGPGGCQSEGTCRTFCSDPNNFEVCRGFTEVSGGSFSGPGGCNSAESCFTYCKENPTNCGYREGEDPGKGIAPGGTYYNPMEMCNRTPNCSWAGNSCSCGYYGETKETVQKAQEYASYCRENPDKCAPGGQPAIFGAPESRQQFEDFCRTNPDKCRPPTEQASQVSYGRHGGYYYSSSGAAPDPAAECSRYGCSWGNSSCQCSSATVRSYTPPAFTEQNPEVSCTSGGCKWTGSSCDCSSVSQDSPALACGRQAGCSWINSACQCGGASGSSASQGYPAYVPPPGPGSYSPAGGSYSGTYDSPETACARGGCSWTGSSCQCSGTSGSGSYTPPSGSGGSYSGSGSYTPPSSGSYTQPYSGSYTPPSGSYTPPSSGSYTPPSSGSYTPPSGGDSGGSAPPPPPPSGDSGGSAPPPSGDSGGSAPPPPPPSGDSGGSMPPPSGVQGVSTVAGMLQRLLDFLQGK